MSNNTTREGWKDGSIDDHDKQVVKGGSRVSILVFDRGIHALNLNSSIIVEEKDPDHPVGKPLMEPIIVSSEDTYEL